MNGVTAFQPRDFHQDFDQQINAPVFLIQAKNFSNTSKKEVDKLKEYQYKKEITLLPGDKYLQLKFGLPNLDIQAESNFAYKLGATNAQWQSTQNNAILLSGLSPGMHTLIFKSMSSINAGFKPHDYLNEVRLQAARLLLEDQSHQDLKSVLDAIGVKDARSFEKKFFLKFGKKTASYFKVSLP